MNSRTAEPAALDDEGAGFARDIEDYRQRLRAIGLINKDELDRAERSTMRLGLLADKLELYDVELRAIEALGRQVRIAERMREWAFQHDTGMAVKVLYKRRIDRMLIGGEDCDPIL